MRHGDSQPSAVDKQAAGHCAFITGNQPSGKEVFCGLGRDDDASYEASLQLLERLSRKIYLDGRRVCADMDNHAVPAGYTYLGQLIAHDVTFNSGPLPRRGQELQGLRNLATSALDLDCIYGGGPDRSPGFYQVEGDPSAGLPRRRLRLGLTRRPRRRRRGGGEAGGCPFTGVAGDLPRGRIDGPASNAADGHGDDALGGRRQFFEALIADTRNENNLVLSQLVLLFHKLHNRIVDAIEAAEPLADPRETFEIARAITVRCYRGVVLDDYLRRLLHPGVHAAYRAKQGLGDFTLLKQLVSRDGLVPIPAEFSMAAFRMGHAQVRARYELNDRYNSSDGHQDAPLDRLLGFNGADAARRRRGLAVVPVSSDWLVDWQRFFAFPQARMPVNPSRRIRPAYVREFYGKRLEAAAPDWRSAPLYADGGRPTYGGLVFRDLARGLAVGLPSGQALARALELPALAAGEISDAGGAGLARIGRFVSGGNPLSHADIDTLSQDTPLLYYVLREAELRHEGLHLGELGSTVTAEVLFGLVAAFGLALAPEEQDWADRLFGEGGTPAEMPDLIAFADGVP